MKLWFTLLAQAEGEEVPRNPFRNIGEHFSRQSPTSPSDATEWILWLLLFLAILLLLMMVGRNLHGVWIRLAPIRMFMAVAREVGLNFADRWWLWRVARHQKLVNPLTLLMSPVTLEHYVARYMREVSSAEARHSLRRMESLRKHLFD